MSRVPQLNTSDRSVLSRDLGRSQADTDERFGAIPLDFLERWKRPAEVITATTERPRLRFGNLSVVNARSDNLYLYLPDALPKHTGRRVAFLKLYPSSTVELVPASGVPINGLAERYKLTDPGLHEVWWDGVGWSTSTVRQPHFNALDFGARGDGATDDTVAITDALTSAALVGGRVVFPPGRYMCSKKIELPDGSDLEIELMRGAIWDFTRATGIPAREACLTIGTDTAGLTALPGLGAHANKFASQITFASAHGLAAGDLFILWDDDSTSWHDASVLLDSRPYYKRGEFLRVRAVVSSTVVSIDTILHDTYLTSANIDLVKVTTCRFNIFGKGKMVGASNALLDVGIQIWNGYRSTIRDIEMTGMRYCHINLWRSYECDIVDVKAMTPNPLGNEGASVFMISNYDCWVRGGSHRAGKHAVSITGGAVASPVPSRICGAENATLRADLTAADMHGHCENCAWKNCDIEGGVALGGMHATISGGRVLSCGDFFSVGSFSGLLIRMREVKGGDFTIDGVECRLNHASAQSSGDFPLALDTTEAILPGRVIVNDVRIRAGYHNNKVVFCYVQPDSAGDIEFCINGLEYEGVSGQQAPTLVIEGSATSAFRRITLENVKGLSPQCASVRTKQLTYRNCEVYESPTSGFIASVIEYSGVTQFIDIIDCITADNDEAGIFVSGTNASYDVYATVRGCRSVNNGQDSGATTTSQVSLRGENLKSLEISGNTWGDTQGSPTQDSLYSVATVTTLFGGGNRDLGGGLLRSLSSVTNDHEVLEFYGTGSPEGVKAAPVGARYTDKTAGLQYWKQSGTSTTGWWTAVESLLGVFPSYGKTKEYEVIDHFTSIGDGLSGLTSYAAGAAAAVTSLLAPATRIGIVDLATGTDTTGLAGLFAGLGVNQSVRLGGGRHRWRWDISLPTLSDGTDRYLVVVGLYDQGTGGSNDVVAFTYSDNSNSGKWNCQTVAAGTTTNTDSTVTVAAGDLSAGTGTAYVLEAEINAGGTEVKFYINGTLRATVTTNIPTNALSPLAQITKSLGTTSRSMQVDTYLYNFQPTAEL